MNQGTKIYMSLIIWIVALIAIGGVIGSLTKPEISTWYSTLNRSPLTPPNYLFPIAWTILYGMIGTCGWLIWGKSSSPKLDMEIKGDEVYKDVHEDSSNESTYNLTSKVEFPKRSIIKTLYVTQLILNWSWTPLFFHYHLTGLSLLVLVAMNILVCGLICLAYRRMKAISLLMIPYLSWILFATYLNFYIWQYN